MAYLPMTQEIIKFMNKDFDKEDIITYQMLITLFGNLFTNEKEFLNDPSDRMGLSHFVENFLRNNDFQTIVTIKDLNLIFNNNEDYDIYNKELYQVFFVWCCSAQIYRLWTSAYDKPDPEHHGEGTWDYHASDNSTGWYRNASSSRL